MFEAAAEISTETLPFLVSDEESGTAAEGEMGIFGRGDGTLSVRQIPVAVLRENLRRTVGSLRELFDEIAAAEGGLPLKEAQITFEVTASGGITIVGANAQAAGKGAITLTFGR
ncbi:Pepco domain-containing protein [Microbispora bryophytorum]|uniref:Pepco domain-containing protein n=1 Tax=Microbispora bryophytorum TaxID=1460882 RepID=UPI003F4D6E8B